MEKCEFCGASLESETSFCGNCGHVFSHVSSPATGISNLPLALAGGDTVPQLDFPAPNALPDLNEATLLRPSSALSGADEQTFQSEHAPLLPEAQGHTSVEDLPTEPLLAVAQQERDEEEEKRRRAALVALGAPLLSGLAQPPASNVPLMAGTPQIGHVPVLTGTPPLGQPGTAAGFAAPGNPAFAPGPGVPQSTPYMPGSGSSGPSLPGQPSPGSPGTGSQGPATGGAPGCVLTLIIVLTALFLILASVITLGLTAWAPNLALSGASTVAPGGTMTLHGTSFLPNSSVDLTLDSSIPIYYLQKGTPFQLADVSQLNASQLFHFSAQGTNALTVPGSGTFTLSFLVNPTWSAGPHTVTAYETLTHRHASVNFTITGVATTTTATATPNATAPASTPSSTPTATPTSPAPTPTNTPMPKPTHTAVVPTATPTHTPVPTPKPTPSPTPTPLPGRLSASPLRINGNTSCSVVRLNYVCSITLTNSSRLTPLNWSVAFSNYTKAPTISASSHTINAASSETVSLLVPTADDRNTITITFTGPANSVSVTWYYQVIIQ